MEQDFQTSFIPKRPVAPVGGDFATEERRQGGGLFMLIAIIIFVVSLLSAGGVFLYKSYLSTRIEETKASLERVRDIFEPKTITQLQVLDKRISAAETILKNHIAVSPILELLKSLTYPNIQYTNFSYVVSPATGDVDVEMKGVATGFDWVGLQADTFGRNPHIKNPIFSNLVQDQFGRITFDLTFSVSRSFVTYGSPLNGTLPNQALSN